MIQLSIEIQLRQIFQPSVFHPLLPFPRIGPCP